MAIYGIYNFSNDPDENKQECIKFFSAVLGRTFGSIDEVEKALSDIYINGRSLEGTDVEEAANTLRESLDVQSNNVAMIKTRDGFERVKSNNYVKMRNINDSSTITRDEWEEKYIRDSSFVDYMNRDGIELDSRIIRVRHNEDNLEYIKNVTGMDDINENNVKTALETIYIDGHNLSDKLGPEAKLEDYVDEVRDALRFRSGSIVTVMKKNSVFARPKAVLPEVADNEKIINTLGYVRSFKKSLSNEASFAEAESERIKDRDAKLFFASLFKEPDPNVTKGKKLRKKEINLQEYTREQLESMDPSELNHKNYCTVAAALFDDPLNGFVTGRSPENLCYAYMLTKTNPNTGKNFTLDELLTDDSEFMNQQKREIGREFCQVF